MLSAAAALSACAGGPSYESIATQYGHNTDDKVTVYLMRPKTTFGVLSSEPAIWLNDERLGVLSSGGFARIQLEPGVRNRVEARWHPLSKPAGAKNSSLSLTGAAGEVFYYSYEIIDSRTEATGFSAAPIIRTTTQFFLKKEEVGN